MKNEGTYDRLKRIYLQGEGEMKRYNHAYTIAFSLDTDEADPYKVSPESLIAALQERVNRLRLNKIEALEGVECWDSVDNDDGEAGYESESDKAFNDEHEKKARQEEDNE